MSLKTFHIVFVVVSTILALGFGVWAFREYRVSGDGTTVWAGVGSLLAAVALVVYGFWFLRKLKGVSYL